MEKTPVVLLPALMCNAGLFLHQIQALKEEVDFFVPDLTLDTDIGSVAERVLREAPDYFALAGISMGGYIAFEIMRRAPERVKRLALIDTSALPDTEGARRKRMNMIETAREAGMKNIIHSVLPNLVAPKHLDNDMVCRVLLYMAEKVGIQGYINQQKIIMSRPDSFPLLPGITCPTLVFGGYQDKLTPPDLMKKIADAIPNAVHAVIADSGHMSPLENPAAVTAVMRAWLFGNRSETSAAKEHEAASA